MRLVSIYNCKEGVVLAKPIYDKSNRILLNAGYELTSRLLQRLENMGIYRVYIESDVTEDIEVQDDVPTKIRFEANRSLARTFKALTEDNVHNKKINQITHGKVIREFKIIYKKMVRQLSFNPNLLNLLSHLQADSNSLFEHSVNTSIYAIAIGRQLYLKDDELYWLGLGAVLHDIGLVKIDKRIAFKKEKLNEEEEKELRKHTEIGYEILKNERDLHLLVAHCAFQHHENIDGTGYPRQLKGDKIHRFGQIIAIANQFDSLMRNWRGNKALLPHEAMEVLVGQCYTRFDKKIVDAFRKAVAIYPIGITVRLNTGERAVVVGYNNSAPERPILRVFTDKKDNQLENYYELDLMKHLNVMITECDAILYGEKMKNEALA